MSLDLKEAPLEFVEASSRISLSDLLDQIEQRANAATPGPWKVVSALTQPSGLAIVTEGGPKSEDVTVLWRRPSGEIIPLRNCEANATFIAAAKTDVPKLVKALRRAIKTLDKATHPGVFKLGERCRMALSDIEKLLREPADSVLNGTGTPPVFSNPS